MWRGNQGTAAKRESEKLPVLTCRSLLPPAEETLPFRCGVPGCDHSFAESKSLVEHIRTHTGETPFVCELCGQKFRQAANLRDHRKTHSKHSDMRHGCPTCGRIFNSRSNLRRHLRTHTGVKTYKCKLCGKLFNQSSNLKTHVSGCRQKAPQRQASH
eukprot:m51a1_g11640 hypothetical protein (157) ;mRNA; f:240-710